MEIFGDMGLGFLFSAISLSLSLVSSCPVSPCRDHLTEPLWPALASSIARCLTCRVR